LKTKKILEKDLKSQLFDVKLGDFNGDGNFEIVVSSEDGRILILSNDGEIIHKLFISEKKPIWDIELYDITQNGKVEIISGGMDGLLNVFYLNNSNVELLWSQQFQSSVSGFFIDDVNDDLQFELIAYGLDKSLRVLNLQNGNLIWGQLFESGIGTVKAYDCDGDGQIELIGGGNDGTIRVFNGKDGSLKWFKKFARNIRCLCCFPNKQTVLCGGDDKKIYFLNGVNGDTIKSLPMEEYVWGNISYLNKNNRSKALVYSYCFDFLEDNFIKNKLKFKSKLLCLNDNLEIDWEHAGFNIETLKIIQTDLQSIFIGTTKGKLILLDENNGFIIDEINLSSSINKIEFWNNRLYCVTRDGRLIILKLQE